MTLKCSNCGSYVLEIVDQSYTDTSAFEKYECEQCGSTGILNAGPGNGDVRLSGLERGSNGGFK